MQLTRYTDYALRVLIFVGTREDGGLSSITEIASTYGISKNHLMKVVQDLGQAGFLATQRGRKGGLRLGRPAAEIRLGEVVRHTEESFALVDCANCLIAPACTLPQVLGEAVQAFLAVLDRYTLEDVLRRRVTLRGLFGTCLPPLPAPP
ncbi:Rrf2 family transcriptional regulator [Roseomonas sp. GC11]|uniref:Rrf2 family transcriptional regulator n=1 Tax=Roseomonas sp. GC11 TaxID=2950546 RepID=UPI00210DE9B5|nr:Rrf2 family transcriptional regulator [Roseomonas sp. GC11]MCQ4159498.1 Rrf2 family transcriptional regulator [Roseomonas sp. GC11]